MIDRILEYLDYAAVIIGLGAVAVIIVGFVLAAGRYAMRFRKVGAENDFHQFKIELGRPMLLGLEILVLADVIETVTIEPTFVSLSVLVFLILLRTIVSWNLHLEIERCWPGQTREEERGDSHA
jgi:uncharacterized membrane protein